MRPLHELLIEAANRQPLAPSTRRGVLAMASVAASVPVASGLQSVLAQVGAEGNKGRKRRRRRNQGQGNNSGNPQRDIAILNYALTLEHLEYAFYRDGLAQFSAGDFGAGVFDLLGDIRDHEQAHVDTLIDVIEDLGGDPVEEGCYNFDALDGTGDSFDFQDPDGFLDIAQLLENTGVMAYTGAIKDIKSGALQEASATIATVEARHASYLNLINGDNPFPDAFDEPKSMEEILAAAGGFIENDTQPCDDGNGE
jgi:rubrerythrin